MAKRMTAKANLDPAEIERVEKGLAKMSQATLAHLNDMEAGVSRDAKKKATAKRTTKKATARKKK